MKRYLIIATTLTLTATTQANETFDSHCAKCHGKDAKGQTAMGKKLNCIDYSIQANWAKLSDAKATKSIKEGVKNEAGVPVMRGYAEKLTDAEIGTTLKAMQALAK